MSKEFNVIITKDAEGYYVADVPELKGCHTQAKSMDALLKRIREVIALCLEDEGAEYEASDFLAIQRIAI